MAHCGITISTCLDLLLGEWPTDLRLRSGESERLGRLLETTVGVPEELYPADVDRLFGLPRATCAYWGMAIGRCLGFAGQGGLYRCVAPDEDNPGSSFGVAECALR